MSTEVQQTKSNEAKKSRWSFFSRKRERAPEEEEKSADLTEEQKNEPALAAVHDEEPTESSQNPVQEGVVQDADIQDASAEDETSQPQESLPPQEENALEHYGFKGLLLILFFLLLGTAPDLFHALQGTALFCPKEAEHITAFLSVRDSGQWIAPIHAMPAEWPGLHWLTSLLALCCPHELWLFTLTGILSSALALLAVWCLSRSAGYGNAAATASGLLLLSAPLFAPIGHIFSNAALASALCVFSLIFLSRGWRGDGRWFSLPLGFLLAGLATLTGGLFYLLLPLLSSFFFFIWCGRYRRAQKADAVFGFLCLLGLILGWLGYMYLVVKDAAYIHNLFHATWRKPWPLDSWWIPFILLGVGSLPWLFAILFPSWIKVAKSAFHTIRASQKEHAASTFIWINLAVGLALTLCMPKAMQPGWAITMICLLAPLLAKTIVRLGPTGARLFISCSMLTLLCAGLVLLLAYFSVDKANLSQYLPWLPPADILQALPKIHALTILGGICIVGAIFLKKYLRKGDTGHMLIAGTVIATLLTLPATLLLVPQLSSQPFAKLSSFKAIQTAYAAKKEAPKAPAEAKDALKAPATAKDAPKAPATAKDAPTAPAESKDAPKAPAEAKDDPKAPAEAKDAPKAPATAKEAPKAPAEAKDAPKAPAEAKDVPKAPAEAKDAPKAPAEAKDAPKAPAEAKDVPKAPADIQEAKPTGTPNKD